jgi:DNA-binding response OmpR family regulator
LRSTHAARVAICLAGGQPNRHARLAALLAAEGFIPESAPDLETAIDRAADGHIGALVLVCSTSRDAGSVNAVGAVRRLRSRGFVAPVLVIGCVATPSDVAAVLDSGADEYVRRPYEPIEVVARLRALIRRSCGLIWLGSDRTSPALDRWRRVLTDGHREVALTARETALLECLAQRAGHPVTREELATLVWGAENADRTATNVVDVYVAYVRRKLGKLDRGSLIRSVRGVGYELVSAPLGPSALPARIDADDRHTGPLLTRRSRRAHDDLDLAPQVQEHADQSIDGETAELTGQEKRELRGSVVHDDCRLGLRESSLGHEAAYLPP